MGVRVALKDGSGAVGMTFAVAIVQKSFLASSSRDNCGSDEVD